MPITEGNAKHRSFAKKRKIRLGSLSVGDGVAIALTAIRASISGLYKTAKSTKNIGALPEYSLFHNALTKVMDGKRGSFYAAFVTSVDQNKLFHGGQFAVSLQRLGILDEVSEVFESQGFPGLAAKLHTYGAYYWADLVYRELKNVRKETSSPIRRALGFFFEGADTTDVDDLIESALLGTLPSSPRAVLAMGLANLEVAPHMRTRMNQAFRTLSSHQEIDLSKLEASTSIDAMFETFYQHLLANPRALQRHLPKVRYSGIPVDPAQLQRVFRDQSLKRVLQYAFNDAYSSLTHSIRISRIHQAFRNRGVYRIAQRVLGDRTGTKPDLTATNAFLNSIIALFSMYTGDAKGQMVPLN